MQPPLGLIQPHPAPFCVRQLLKRTLITSQPSYSFTKATPTPTPGGGGGGSNRDLLDAAPKGVIARETKPAFADRACETIFLLSVADIEMTFYISALVAS